jgi:two-component system, NtrC family, nitrogen regulation response regulator NtrX
VFPVLLPPLRERREDIGLLARHFAQQVALQNGWKEKAFADSAIAELERYSWPGNVRELRNVVERILLLASGDSIDAAVVKLALPAGALQQASGQAVSGAPTTDGGGAIIGDGTLAARTEGFERETILAELKKHGHHMTNTAKALGLERSHLYKKCQQLGIDLRAVRKAE